ncbi:hypothetical protein HN51_004967 [Arachis hypogaea]
MASPIAQPRLLGFLCILFILASSGLLLAEGRSPHPRSVCDGPCTGYGDCITNCAQKGFRSGSCTGFAPRVILCCCYY